ncbi:hypothetical protein EAG14_09530 [Acidovorax sp. 1608163]|uniref:hypothetical protein n=1 Tax=Acidovorax sp. 1608163 TaxID=2478662 RepID=UPI000EF6A971|nr:hypothetical protein [Acidovorax sp. 1608163]AYM96274.1 hypothetical protein EAG14_09530 [Acidovorax sp. 1608163]
MPQELPSEIEYWYDVEDHIDLDWFERYINQIESFANNAEKVRIEVWMCPAASTRRTIFYTSAEARVFITSEWPNIEESVITQYAGKVRQSLLHHQHHYLRIRIDETPELPASQAVAALQKNFKLVPSKPHPYKYRKSSIEFEVGQWSPKDFGIGVEAIAKAIGPNPYLENAFVKSFDGEIERLTPFFTLESFYEYLNRRASTFGEVSVQLRARSITVGISSPTDHKKLRIRTSIPPEKVDPLIDAWPSTLKLKQVKAMDTGDFFTGSVPSEKDESKWMKLGVPIATALITAFSVTSMVSLKKAIWPEQKLILVSPKQEGVNSAWIGKRLEVDWYLQPEQPSFRNIAKDVSAVVSLTDQAGQPKEVSGKPPVIFDVTPGTYNLAVNVEGLPTLRMQVKVDRPSAETSSGPPK